MKLIDDINLTYEYWKNGLLTYSEMLNRIAQLVENEKDYIIEYKASKGSRWKVFSDTVYTLTEAQEETARLNESCRVLTFRYKATS